MGEDTEEKKGKEKDLTLSSTAYLLVEWPLASSSLSKIKENNHMIILYPFKNLNSINIFNGNSRHIKAKFICLVI